MNRDKGTALRIVVFGVVQGVGFRPFVYRLAHRLGYAGWVKNIGFGVEIHLERREKPGFNDFLDSLRSKAPPLAQIESLEVLPVPFTGADGFEILSTRQEKSFVFISPDISVCGACRKEMKTPGNRRFRYPFINCTDCGPRYTIVESLPYDRSRTTMKRFEMCASCRREYTNPFDRRYHAQPIACPDCGPKVRLLESRTGREVQGGIEKAASLLEQGKILAVKGLGGFHLVSDALHAGAVRKLRRIKERKRKPLALMARGLDAIAPYARIRPSERALLLSPRRPIVLLKKRREIPFIAPHLDEVGCMLPYTPLHDLLLEKTALVVATSSNRKDAPIMKEMDEEIDALSDFILTHDRPIHMRADDSVLRVANGKPLFVRRARGFVPYPQPVPRELASDRHILAVGGELKDTVSVYKKGYIITSQFLGDLDEYKNYRYFEETINHMLGLFDVHPEIVVSDLHPGFHTTKFARRLGIPHIQVQHHFAHVLAALIEHSLPPGQKVLGVSFDGYGYGDDGKAWGGEFLLADYSGYERFAHFNWVPLPGGDLAARQPWRMALSYLMSAFGEDYPRPEVLSRINPRMVKGVEEMIRHRFRCPPTSSCGRLFDAVSFLTGLSPGEREWEAEAPMRLEAAADPRVRTRYGFELLPPDPGEVSGSPHKRESRYVVSFAKCIRGIVEDCARGDSPSRMSAKFHNTLVAVIAEMAEKAKMESDITSVVLAGGVFLNRKLVEGAEKILIKKGFSVLRPMQYSPNDESLSLGQIAYALASEKRKSLAG